MINWKEQLEKKAKELHIEFTPETKSKEVIDAPVRSISDNTNTNSDSIRTQIPVEKRINLNKNVSAKDNDIIDKNKVKFNEGGLSMIKAKDVLTDYDAIVKETISDNAKIVKILRLVLKLLINIRTNQGVKGQVGVDKPEVKPEGQKPTGK